MKQEKLRLIEKTKKDYFVETPKRLKDLKKSLVRLEIKRGEYMFNPRKHTFLVIRRLTSEELRAIADKLEELNQNKQR